MCKCNRWKLKIMAKGKRKKKHEELYFPPLAKFHTCFQVHFVCLPFACRNVKGNYQKSNIFHKQINLKQRRSKYHLGFASVNTYMARDKVGKDCSKNTFNTKNANYLHVKNEWFLLYIFPYLEWSRCTPKVTWATTNSNASKQAYTPWKILLSEMVHSKDNLGRNFTISRSITSHIHRWYALTNLEWNGPFPKITWTTTNRHRVRALEQNELVTYYTDIVLY